MKLNKKQIIVMSIIGLSIVVTIVLIVNLASSLKQYKEAEQEYTEVVNSSVVEESNVQSGVKYSTEAKLLNVSTVQSDDTSSTVTMEADKIPNITIDFDELLSVNKDCIGWIYVPNTRINYPIVQSHDNIDYVKSTFSGSENKSGAIFSDCRIVSPFSQKTIIYGHNMKNGTMFHDLLEIEADDSIKDIWVFTVSGHIYHYTVKEVIRTDMLDKNVYSVKAEYSDELVLSTCIANKDRLVVIAERDWYKFNG